jgi:hypothetical protein
MSVVTIRGHLGSGAPEIGKKVADRLHIDYIDREIIADVAQRLKWPKEGIAYKEMPPGTLLGRIAEALGHSHLGEAALSKLRQSKKKELLPSSPDAGSSDQI